MTKNVNITLRFLLLGKSVKILNKWPDIPLWLCLKSNPLSQTLSNVLFMLWKYNYLLMHHQNIVCKYFLKFILKVRSISNRYDEISLKLKTSEHSTSRIQIWFKIGDTIDWFTSAIRLSCVKTKKFPQNIKGRLFVSQCQFQENVRLLSTITPWCRILLTVVRKNYSFIHTRRVIS